MKISVNGVFNAYDLKMLIVLDLIKNIDKPIIKRWRYIKMAMNGEDLFAYVLEHQKFNSILQNNQLKCKIKLNVGFN